MKTLMLFVVVISTTFLFTACKKDKFTEENSGGSLQLLKIETFTNGIESRGCTAGLLQGVGCIIHPIIINNNNFYASGSAYYWYTSPGNPIYGIAGFIISTDQRILSVVGSRMQSSPIPQTFIQLDNPGTWIPRNENFHVTLIGINKCGQVTRFVGTFIFPSDPLKNSIPMESMSLPGNKTAVRYKLDPTITLSELEIK